MAASAALMRVIVRRAALQVIDPSQDRLLAARHRGLLPESIRDFGNSPREFLFDIFALAKSTRGASAAPDTGSCNRTCVTFA